MTGTVCTYSPYASGGMPRYVAEVLAAVSRVPGAPPVEWVASVDLDPRFRSEHHPVHRVLPALSEPDERSSRLGWVVDRVQHYARRETRFTSWVRDRPDVVGVHFQETPHLVVDPLVRWLRRRGVAVFFTVHNVRPHTYPGFLPRRLVDTSLRRAYERSDCLFVHSEGLAHELAAFLGRAVDDPTLPRIRVVEHGVWTTDETVAASPVRLVERLRRRRLLCFGTIRRNKGIHHLLQAAADGLLGGCSITVAGEPLEHEYVEETLRPLARRAEAAGVPVDLRATFVPDDDIAPMFEDHSVLVLPYTEDFVAQSGAAFLAVAHGTPLVATRSGGLHDLLRRRRIGAIAQEPSAPAVARAVTELLATPEDEVPALVEGIAGARAELGWEGLAEATAAEYARVLGARTPRPVLPGAT